MHMNVVSARVEPVAETRSEMAREVVHVCDRCELRGGDGES